MNLKKYKKEKKPVLSVSLDPDVLEKFIRLCDRHDLNRSKIVNDLILKFLEKEVKRAV